MKQDFIELFDLTSGQATSQGWFKKEDIYHVEVPAAEDKWVTVKLHTRTANWEMFVFMGILAAFVIGIPWFIAYCSGVYVKTTQLFIPRAQYENLFNLGTN